jgi:hypothetical protein
MRSVAVDNQGDRGEGPIRAQNVAYSVTVQAHRPEEEIHKLITHTDRVTEVHNSLRMGTDVTLAHGRALCLD